MLPEHNNLLIFHLLLFLALVFLFIVLMPLTLILFVLTFMVILILIIFLLGGLRHGSWARLVYSNWWWLGCLHMRCQLRWLLPLYSGLIISKLRMCLWVDGICLMWIVLCFYGDLLVVGLLWGSWVHTRLHVYLRRASHVHAHRLHSRIKRWITSHKI